jgi:hypothetical protein
MLLTCIQKVNSLNFGRDNDYPYWCCVFTQFLHKTAMTVL